MSLTGNPKGGFMMKRSVAWIDDVSLIHVDFKNRSKNRSIETHLDETEKPQIFWQRKKKFFITEIIDKPKDGVVMLRLFEPLPLGEELVLLWGEIEIPVHPRAIVRTAWFEQHYTDTEATLGAVYTASATTFTLWAPTATSITLNLAQQSIKLERQAKGIWQKKVPGDWHRTPYTYDVRVNGQITRANDPYAKAMLANSEKGVVVDFSKTNPDYFYDETKPRVAHLQDSIIYELHVRDATIQAGSGVHNRGTFLGLTETATTTEKGFSTALNYVKALGVTHVQLMPINDFARVNELKPAEDYNWGYDPLYFQVPEGSYATDAQEPVTRIKECKEMVQAFHREGMSVILDVVYNHVFIIEESAFEQIVPGYYFRYKQDGTLSNGTGVGNDFASERVMGRKFILETIDFWLREYRVDGFRFDLMGIMDTETMKRVRARCDQEKTPIMLLGEGWDLPTALSADQKATSQQSHQLPGIRFFNDYFRDTVKGNLWSTGDQGYVNGAGRFREQLPHIVSGSSLQAFGHPFVSDVTQTINFVECHDNYTLWDQLERTNPHDTESVRKKMHQLATGITLLSQGVPFLHAGQEWFQTKQGDGNSYISGDAINQLDWHKREMESENITFIQTLITLRKKYDVFRLKSKQAINDRLYILTTPEPVGGFTLLGNNEDLVVYINPTNQTYPIRLPSSAQWDILATNDSTRRQTDSIIIGDTMKLKAYEFLVMLKPRT